MHSAPAMDIFANRKRIQIYSFLAHRFGYFFSFSSTLRSEWNEWTNATSILCHSFIECVNYTRSNNRTNGIKSLHRMNRWNKILNPFSISTVYASSSEILYPLVSPSPHRPHGNGCEIEFNELKKNTRTHTFFSRFDSSFPQPHRHQHNVNSIARICLRTPVNCIGCKIHFYDMCFCVFLCPPFILSRCSIHTRDERQSRSERKREREIDTEAERSTKKKKRCAQSWSRVMDWN